MIVAVECLGCFPACHAFRIKHGMARCDKRSLSVRVMGVKICPVLVSKLVHLQCAAGNSRTSVSKSILILLLSSGLSLWNIHRRIFICKKRNKNHGEYSRWLECCAECSASLRSVINHRQQPHKTREIIKGWLEDTSWLLPLGKTINAPPHCSGGRETKGGCSPAVKELTDLHVALLLKLHLLVLHCIISFFLCLSPTLFLSISRAGPLLSFPVPHNFYPHLICYPLPPPYTLLSPASLALLVCRQESKHWKVYALCFGRTGQDNEQRHIKVNEISRFSCTVLPRHARKVGNLFI